MPVRGTVRPAAVGAALQRTCVRVSETLADTMGEAGCNALLARALARAEVAHPALRQVRLSDDGGVHLDGVVASVEAHGAVAATAAVEALLVALVDVLVRLIGEDMTVRLIEPDAAQSSAGDGAQAP